MTTTNNIPTLIGSGVQNVLKSQGVNGTQPGLLGFLNLILQNINGTPNLQNLQGAQGNLPDLAAKIAELLKNNPTDQAGLQKLIQSFAPNATPQQAQQIANFLQQVNAGAATPKAPGLIRDLAASLATDLQQVQNQNIETQVAQALEGQNLQTGQIVQALNNISPGANGDTLDPSILEQLQKQFDLFKQSGSTDIEKFVQDVTALLQGQGLDVASITQHLNAFAQNLRQTVVVANTPASQPVTTMLGQQIKDNTQAPGTTAGNISAENTDAAQTPAFLQTKPAQSGQLPPQAAAMQAQAQQTAPALKPSAMPTHPSVINSILGQQAHNGGGENGFSGFGHQQQGGGYQPEGSALDATGLIKHSADTHAHGFTNYMAAARGQSPMTQMVGMHISRNAAAKIDTFTVQLQPLELGALEVRMKFDKNGGMKAHLIAEKPETLAMLQKDSAHLERILQEAGIDVDENALSFDLRQQGRDQLDEGSSDGQEDDGDFAASLNGTAAEKMIQAKIAIQTYGYISQNGVDIRV